MDAKRVFTYEGDCVASIAGRHSVFALFKHVYTRNLASTDARDKK